MKLRVGVSLLVLQMLLACTTFVRKPAPKVASVSAREQLNKIQKDIATGSTRHVVTQLRQLIVKNPNSDVSDTATMILAGLYYRHHHYEPAYNTYMSLVNSNVFSPNEAGALLGASRCLINMGRLDESLALSTRGLKIPGLSDRLKLDFTKQQYTVYTALGNQLGALSALAYIYVHDPKIGVRKEAETHAYEILNKLDPAGLQKVEEDAQYGFVRAEAAYRVGVAYFQNKDLDGARPHFENAREWAQGTPLEAQAESYLGQIDSRHKVDANTIGAVLPLTGRYASIAERTLHGLQLGLGIYGPNRSSFHLAVVDSEGTPEGAKHAVERLVSENNVIAVVGSLLSREAEAVAEKTEELGIPSFTLSQKAGLTAGKSYVFRDAVTSEMQVKALVHVAMDQLGYKRFAILFPNDNYGVEYANLFWDAVLAHGGVIAGAQPYNPTETDFRGPIKRLVGTYYLQDRKIEYANRLKAWYAEQGRINTRKRPPDDLLPPIVDFDAIFVPDGPKAIGQIAPMLAYQGIQNVRLLGTNIWNTSELVRRGGNNVEDSIFVDSNLVNNPAFGLSPFFHDYQNVFGSAPGLFEAQGYEVGKLLRGLIANGENTRAGLASALSEIHQFQGVTGPMSMNENHDLVRPLTVLTVKNGQIGNWSSTIK